MKVWMKAFARLPHYAKINQTHFLQTKSTQSVSGDFRAYKWLGCSTYSTLKRGRVKFVWRQFLNICVYLYEGDFWGNWVILNIEAAGGATRHQRCISLQCKTLHWSSKPCKAKHCNAKPCKAKQSSKQASGGLPLPPWNNTLTWEGSGEAS